MSAPLSWWRGDRDMDGAIEFRAAVRRIVAEWEAMRVDPAVDRTDNDTDAIHRIADLLRGES